MTRTRDGKRILYILYTNPGSYPPLEHSSHILANSGWRVMFLGTGGFGSGDLRLRDHPNIEVHRMRFQPGGWRQKVHYLWFCLWALLWTVCWRPGWVYASDPLSCPAALLLSHLPGVRVVYHEHDTPMRAPDSAFMRLVMRARALLAGRARLCVLPNEERAEYFGQSVSNGTPVMTVWNCPERQEVTGLASDGEVREGNDLWLWYHGSIVPAQLPETVIEALALLPACVKLVVAGYETVGHQGYVERLKQRAVGLGAGERFRFMGALPTRADLLQQCASADVGLALFTSEMGRPMVGASNKPFDYLACGLPLLVPDRPDWREMYVEAGYGLACDPDDAESIAAALRWYLDHRDQMRAMGEGGRRRTLKDWNYETQFEFLLDLLEDEVA